MEKSVLRPLNLNQTKPVHARNTKTAILCVRFIFNVSPTSLETIEGRRCSRSKCYLVRLGYWLRRSTRTVSKIATIVRRRSLPCCFSRLNTNPHSNVSRVQWYAFAARFLLEREACYMKAN